METASPFIRIIEGLASGPLHQEVWAACTDKRWYFGNQSNSDASSLPFWKMDLDGVSPIDRLWERARGPCEELVGHRLRVVRQYANGHTYGLGGRPHADDTREGCVTLLYYPMPAWLAAWEGETLFFGPAGNVIAGVVPAPDRAVLFDSRIPHTGRAPSRYCGGLRVTVAFKLEPADGTKEAT